MLLIQFSSHKYRKSWYSISNETSDGLHVRYIICSVHDRIKSMFMWPSLVSVCVCDMNSNSLISSWSLLFASAVVVTSQTNSAPPSIIYCREIPDKRCWSVQLLSRNHQKTILHLLSLSDPRQNSAPQSIGCCCEIPGSRDPAVTTETKTQIQHIRTAIYWWSEGI